MPTHLFSTHRRLGILGGLDVGAVLGFVQLLHSETKLQNGATKAPEFTLSCCAGDALLQLLVREDWQELTERLVREGLRLVAAGAEGLLLCDLALSPVARDVGHAVQLPIIGVTSGVIDLLKRQRCSKVVIVGARTKREERYWTESLDGIEVVWPSRAERRWLEEWVGNSNPTANAAGAMVQSFKKAGAEAVIVIDPALRALFNANEVPMPVLQVQEIQAWSAAAWLAGSTQRRVSMAGE